MSITYPLAGVLSTYQRYVLGLSLKVYGLDATLYKPYNEENLYGEVTYEEWSDPVATFKVIFDQPLIGLDPPAGSISLIDRYDQELVMRTVYPLQEHDKLIVTTEDGNKIQVKVVNPSKANVDHTSERFKYYVSVI